MVKITLATSNPHKTEEINNINTNPEIVFETVKGDFDPVENGKTFIENALIKARAAANISHTYCVADDSGLCVDALDSRPGIYSARYAPSQKEKIEKLLGELKNIAKDKRTAHFICAAVLVDKDGNVIHTEEGRIDGYIDFEAKGTNGFGFDPVFFVPEYGKTMAELPEETKNKISHRGRAFSAMIKKIEEKL